MEEIKLYKTKTKGLKAIGMCIPFIATGLWIITENPNGSTEYFMGWVCIIFFEIGIFFGLFQILDKRPQIVITENGIWDRTTNQDEIRWGQIIEAYPIEIHGQKFISLVTDDTFIFKKMPSKWATKINAFIGAQNLNLYLGQLTIDDIELTDFINKLSKESIKERRKLIKTFEIKKINFPTSYLKKTILYFFISILLIFITLSSFAAFMTIIVVMGSSTIIVRWKPANTTLRKYAGIVTMLGFINMVLCLGTIKLYDKITEEVAEKVTFEIESFHKLNTTFPTDIKSITNKLDLNFIEHYFANQIDYTPFDNTYELEATMLMGKRRKFDKLKSEWK